VRHLQLPLRESGSDGTEGSWAIWAMKRETQRAATQILRNKSMAWLARTSLRSGARGGNTHRKRQRKQMDGGTKAGRKNSAQLFHFFMCLRMVSAFLLAATPCFAICCEYHTSVILRRFFFKSRYAFRQATYIACVSSFRVSRLALLGV
jgi:hypothetical protein